MDDSTKSPARIAGLSEAEAQARLTGIHCGPPPGSPQLLDITRGRAAGPFERAIDVQVGRLRRKIEADPKNPALIKTVRSGGYVLASAVESR